MSEKAVVDGRLVYTSASQINTHKMCPSKWYFTYVLGFRAPATAAQSGGLSLHKQMEDYGVDRTKLPTLPGALKFIEEWDWPAPEDCLIEHPKGKELGLMVADTRMVGAIDLLTKPDGDGVVTIVDWKTTSDYKYMLKLQDFDTNVQLMTYGQYAVDTWPEVKGVNLLHVYFLTKPHQHLYRKVGKLYTPEDIKKNYQAFVVPEVYTIRDTCSIPNLADVPTDTDSCFKFGPCAFRFGCSAFKAKYGPPRGADPFNGALLGLNSVLGNKPSEESIMSLDDLFGPNKQSGEKSDMAKLEEMADKVPAEQRVNPPDAAKGYQIPKAEFNLYINCFVERDPQGFTYNYLDELILEYAAPICKAAGVQDVREIKFGEGKLALLRAFRDNPPKGNIYAREYGLQLDVLEVLKSMAKVVVRG